MKIKPYAHYFIIAGTAALLVALGQLGGGQTAWAGNEYFQTVPSPTPVGGGGGGGGGSAAESRIIGTVADLSTGKAGAGITVRINGVEVVTDSFGDYSLSGLSAGDYAVSLVLTGEALPAVEFVLVTLDGTNQVVVNLNYYSAPQSGFVPATPVGLPSGSGGNAQPAATPAAANTGQSTAGGQANQPAAPTAPPAETAAPDQAAQTGAGQVAPQPAPADTVATAAPQPTSQPVALPQTGRSAGSNWWLLAVAGGVMAAAGVKLFFAARPQ